MQKITFGCNFQILCQISSGCCSHACTHIKKAIGKINVVGVFSTNREFNRTCGGQYRYRMVFGKTSFLLAPKTNLVERWWILPNWVVLTSPWHTRKCRDVSCIFFFVLFSVLLFAFLFFVGPFVRDSNRLFLLGRWQLV